MRKKKEYGYVDREGNFYGCPYHGHLELADELCKDSEEGLEKAGWLSLKSHMGKYIWFYLADRPMYPSQKQWDFVFDWCRANDQEFPPNMLDMLWEDQNN